MLAQAYAERYYVTFATSGPVPSVESRAMGTPTAVALGLAGLAAIATAVP